MTQTDGEIYHVLELEESILELQFIVNLLKNKDM